MPATSAAPIGAADPFVHLHCHSHYSMLDGGVSVQAIVDQAVQFEMDAVAVTDHGNMCAAIEFYNYATSKGVRPIIGFEAYVSADHTSKADPKRHHLLLLAENYAGYRNLVKLSARGYRDGYYYRPRIDLPLLEQHKEGVIVTSACLAGEVTSAAAGGRLDEAMRIAGVYRDIFGPDNYYIEVQNHGIAAQLAANDGLVKIARELGLKLIGSNDSHYLTREDANAHDALLCICTGALKAERNRFKFENNHFYFKSPAEMAGVLAEWPDAYHNTNEVAARCKVEMPFGQYHLPKFPDVPEGMTEAELLRKICEQGCVARYGRCDGEVRERLEMELAVIEQMGFPGYFLITSDFIKYAKDQGIPVGPGRGSAAGSIVAYASGIVDVDPLKYGLLFERFLNKSRISMPDIDIDFDPEGREQVIDYVREKYGSNSVCQIITFGTMKARAVIRDVGRVLDISLPEVDALAKKVPNDLKITLELAEKDEEFSALVHSDTRYEELLEIAKRLEGLVRHASIHAAGVIIAPGPLEDYVPLYRNGDDVVTQYSMEYCEQIGLLKMDFLGLRNLTIIKRCVEILKKVHDIDLDFETVDLDDPKTYEELARGNAIGVFQLESEGMRRLLTRLQPDKFDDLIALLAMYRPGPLGKLERVGEVAADLPDDFVVPAAFREIFAFNPKKKLVTWQGSMNEGQRDRLLQLGPDTAAWRKTVKNLEDKCKSDDVLFAKMREGMSMVDIYVETKHGRMPRISLHESIDDILGETHGVILYQEQVMRIAQKMGGFSLAEADNLRKAMGKKKADLMQKFKDQFVRGAEAQGIDAGTAITVFDLMAYFAGYGFNKSHSTAYALITFQTAYLKARYPTEYMAALLTCEMGSTDKLVQYVEDARALGEIVRAPNINEGESGFTVTAFTNDDGRREIVFGLGGIKGVSTGAVDAIAANRDEHGPFLSLLDLCERVEAKSLNKLTMEALAKAGAFDGFGGEEFHRARILGGLETCLNIGVQTQKEQRSGQKALFGAPEKGDAAMEARQLKDILPQVTPFTSAEQLALEKEVLGMFVSSHPLAEHAETLREFSTHSVATAAQAEPGTRAVIGGYLTDCRTTVIKRGKSEGKKMGMFKLEDLTGSLSAVMFAEAFEAYGEQLRPDNIVFLQGRIDFRERMGGGGRGRNGQSDEGESNEPAAEPQIIVDKIIPIGEVRLRLTKSLRLRLDAEAATDDLLDKIEQHLRDNLGRVPVHFDLRCAAGDVTVKAGPRFNVKPTEQLAQALAEVVGAQSVLFDTTSG